MKDLLIYAGLLATASAQAVTSLIVPSSTPLAGCQNSAQGTFGLGIQNATGFNVSGPTSSRRSYDKVAVRDIATLFARQTGGFVMTLVGGVLMDQNNRTGYIASNYQFQFDGPPQAGAIYTAGWSVCSNGSIALGGQAIFWECPSGGFYNLYDRNWAPHCLPINFIANGVGSLYSTAAPAGEVTATTNQNSIVNGGGTQTGSAAASSTAAASDASTTASSMSENASSAASSVSSMASSGAASASSAASSVAASATSTIFTGIAAQATAFPQQVLAVAAGIFGAIVMA